jgi:hypothetical protein
MKMPGFLDFITNKKVLYSDFDLLFAKEMSLKHKRVLEQRRVERSNQQRTQGRDHHTHDPLCVDILYPPYYTILKTLNLR